MDSVLFLSDSSDNSWRKLIRRLMRLSHKDRDILSWCRVTFQWFVGVCVITKCVHFVIVVKFIELKVASKLLQSKT